MAKLLIPKEIIEGERRVAAIPETVKRLTRLGCEVTVESGAGTYSRISDSDFQENGANSNFLTGRMIFSSEIF